MKLTQRPQSPNLNINNIIHVVNTGDTSQAPSGSSYFARLGDILNLISIPQDITITGGTYSNGTLILNNNTGGTITITGFTSGGDGTDNYFISGSSGEYSVKVINDTIIDATGNYAFAEGQNTLASGEASHAEGNFSIASGNYSHAEGNNTVASGNYSHAEGASTIASGEASHSEGNSSQAYGNFSHAEGVNTIAGGNNSFASGFFSVASGNTSFIYSRNSIVTGNNSAVLGGQNITGSADNTVYTPFLNIQSASTDNTLVNILVRDLDGSIKLRSVSTISGSSYNDTYITGGTYSNGSATFKNNTGGTFTITGFSTGSSSTDTYITGGTYSNGTTTFKNNTGGTFSITGYSTGSTSNGWALNGNTVGSEKYIGTNDNFDLPFRTNGIEKARLTANGKLGINTVAPTAMIDLRSTGSTGLYVDMASNVGLPAVEIATVNSLGLSIIGGGNGIDMITNSTSSFAINSTSLGSGFFSEAAGVAGTFTSKFSNAGLFAQTGLLTGNNSTDTVAIYRNFSYTGNGITGFTASGSVLNINDDTYSQGPLLRITKRNVDRFVIKSGGTMQYIDGNQANGYVLTSDANGNASWQVASGGGSGTSYTFSTGLTNSGNTITANLSTGVAGGQSVIGGTANSEILTLSSTAGSTKGRIFFGSGSTYNEANGRLGIGTTLPGARGDFWTTNGSTCLRIVNSDATTANSGNTVGWYFSPVTNGANTNMPLYEQYSSSTITMRVNFHAGGNVTIGNGSGSGDAKLHVIGNIKIQDGTQANGYVLTSDINGLATWQPSSSNNYITGITNSNNVITLRNNTGGTLSTVFNTVTGLTISTFTSTGSTRLVEASSGGTLSATKAIVDAIISDSNLISQLQTPSSWSGTPPTATPTGSTTGYQGQQYFGAVSATSYVFMCKQDGVWVRSLLS